MTNKTWSRVIQESIARKNVSVTDLAKKVGCTRVTIYNLINRRQYRKPLFLKICKELSLDPVFMVSLDYKIDTVDDKEYVTWPFVPFQAL